MTLPAESPWFTGHFPGRPILPGIAHLGLVEAALMGVGETRPIQSLTGVRWRKPAGPGDELELRASGMDGKGLVRFEVARGAEILSQGSIGFERDETGEPAPESEEEMAEAIFPPPGELIPHAPPALLIERILRLDPPEKIVCHAVIPADHPLVRERQAPTYLSLEAGAQAAALLEALGRGKEAGAPRIGYLVGIRTARLREPALPAGEPFRLTARLTGGAPPLSIYEVVCHLGRAEVARGTLSTYLTEDEAGP